MDTFSFLRLVINILPQALRSRFAVTKHFNFLLKACSRQRYSRYGATLLRNE